MRPPSYGLQNTVQKLEITLKILELTTEVLRSFVRYHPDRIGSEHRDPENNDSGQ